MLANTIPAAPAVIISRPAPSRLSICGKGEAVTLEQLREIPTPRATRSWCPIPHAEYFDFVRSAAESRGLAVVAEGFKIDAAAKGARGDRAFCLFRLAHGSTGEYAMTIGARNCHDMAFRASVFAGMQVFTCTNLNISAELHLGRKHTTNIMADLPHLVRRVVGRLPAYFDAQAQRVEAYRDFSLSAADFHDLAVLGIDAGAVAASKLPKLLGHWREPEHEEFKPRTLWSAFNAFTEVFKEYSEHDLPARSHALQVVCDARAGIGANSGRLIVDTQASLLN